ncbi:MAG: hypothetical protein S4CHLAM102_04290 [Chlamydiia bacterium]|nr:hypothetical protein [Chlamydiia bacterium]
MNPEEIVRQELVERMRSELGFNRQEVLIEKKLNQLPHLQGVSYLPNRRLDVVVMCRDIHPHHPFFPLLIIECKAEVLDEKAMRQVIGYNHFVNSFYISLACPGQIWTGWYSEKRGDYDFIKTLPHYDQLMEPICKSASNRQ